MSAAAASFSTNRSNNINHQKNSSQTKTNIMETLQAVVIEAKDDQPKATLIWMHGLGDSSDGFEAAFRQHSPAWLRVILPNAPPMPVTVNGGMVMRSWYDIVSLDRGPGVEALEDRKGIAKSASLINQLVKQETNIILNNDHSPDNNNNNLLKDGSLPLFVGGFSQGAAMTMHVGLRYKEAQLAGLIACSGYVLQFKDYPDAFSPFVQGAAAAAANDDDDDNCKNRSRHNNDNGAAAAAAADDDDDSNRYRIPCCVSHGDCDEVVPLSFAKEGYDHVSEHGGDIDFAIEYGLPHSISMDTLERIFKFMNQRIHG